MKSLVLAEKPSVAREIARVLKCNKKSKGYIEGPQYVVTWALGHLVTLAEPDDYDKKLKQWCIEDLPMLPEKMKIKVMKKTCHQFNVIKSIMKRGDIKELIIATDAGREGELVARWIMAKANWRKPFKRLWISSQTDAAIAQGFVNLKEGRLYNNLYDAAVCRAEADWLIGLNITRALTCKYNAQLNAGRVQTPTLAMIIKREEEINEFKPVDYWRIRVYFEDYYGDWNSKKGSKIFEHAKVLEISEKIKGHTGIITEINTQGKSEPAPLLYDLTELQRDANRRFAFSAKKTLSILQDLYERHKLVTYPRTDSRYITTDIVATLPARLKAISAGPYAELAKPLLKTKLSPGKRFVNNNKVTDHHAIIPTEQAYTQAGLDSNEKKIHDLIVRRFIAVLYPDYKYDQTTIITEVNGESFYSRGKVVKDRGWRAVTVNTMEKEELNEEKIPEQSLSRQKKGDKKEIVNSKINRAKTKPPARYTEATLLTAMENAGKFIKDQDLRESIKGSGLGTPATRAEIIEKLLNTFYIERHGKELLPTSKGKQLIELVPETLRMPELTAQWEQRLSSIADGKSSKKEFLTDIRKNTAEIVKKVKLDTGVYKADNITKNKCPICGKNMLLVKAKKGKMLVCPDPGCGHREPEKKGEDSIFKKDKKTSRVNQKLIKQYSDNKNIGQNLGELFKEALEKKKSDEY